MKHLISFLEEAHKLKAPVHMEIGEGGPNGSVLVTVASLSEIWELNFYEDGRIEGERFVSEGFYEGEKALTGALEFWRGEDE